MQFQAIKVFTSNPELPAAQTAAMLLRAAADVPVQLLPLSELVVELPADQQRDQLEMQLTLLRGQLEAAEFFLAEAEHNPLRFAVNVLECSASKTRFEQRIHKIQGELMLMDTLKGGAAL